MRAFLRMWRYPRMIVLTAMCGALYAAALTVFRIPGAFSIYVVAQLLPIPLSLMFGPAAAVGCGLGAVLASVLTGEVSAGSLFGFLTNFTLGYLPYCLWTRLRPLAEGARDVVLKGWRPVLLYGLVCGMTGFGAGIVHGAFMAATGVAPYPFIVGLIGIQDSLVGLLAVSLLLAIYSRVRRMNLLWWEIMPEEALDRPERPLGVVAAWTILPAVLVGGAAALLPVSQGTPIGSLAAVVIVLCALLMV